MASSAETGIPEPRNTESEDEEPLWPGFVLRMVLPGTIGTILIALGAFGVGWLPVDTAVADLPVIDALRGTPIGEAVSKFAVVAGILILIQAWLFVGYDVMKGRIQDARRLWLILAAWCAPLLLTPPLFSRDVYSYFTQGRLWIAGYNPYEEGTASISGWFNDGGDPMWSESKTPYGQFFLLLERGVVAFSGPHAYTGAIVFRVIALIGVALLAWAVVRLATWCGIQPSKAVWMAALNPLVILHFVSGAHNDALMVGLVAAGLVLAVERYAWAGVILVTLAGAIKPIGLLALPFVGLIWAGTNSSWSRRFAMWIATGFIAVLILGLFGWLTGTGFGWINALSTPGAVRTWLSPPTAVGMNVGSVGEIFGLSITDQAVNYARLAGTAFTVLILAWLCLKPEGRTPIRGAALAFFWLVALGPIVQPWYLLWSLPLFAASGLPRWQFRVATIGTVLLTLYSGVGSGGMQENYGSLSDTTLFIIALAFLVAMLWVSKREWGLLFGQWSAPGLVPVSDADKARASQATMRKPGEPLASA